MEKDFRKFGESSKRVKDLDL